MVAGGAGCSNEVMPGAWESHQPSPPQTRRRSGRPKPIPFTYIPLEDQKEYYELSLGGAPSESEAMLGGLTGYYDTGGDNLRPFPPPPPPPPPPPTPPPPPPPLPPPPTP